MKVSVVIPTYRRPEVLAKAIDSVLEQTFQAFDIIIVSDGYHEETDIMMKSYRDNDRIHYYTYETNKGANHARNYGIKKSTSEYIAFLDDDDFWDNTKLEKQVNVLDENPNIGLVYTGKKIVYPSLDISYENLPSEVGDLSEKIFYSNYIGSTSNVMIRSRILEETGLFDERLPSMQDRELWLRVCQVTEIGAVSEPLFIYVNQDSNDQISNSWEKKIKAFEIIDEKYANTFVKFPELREAFESKVIETVIRIAQRTEDKEILKRYSKIYWNKYKNLHSFLFLCSTKVPFRYLLKLRTLKS